METGTETNLKIMGLSRKSQNGQVIDNRGFDLEYDGNHADINSFVNNQNKHITLDNKEFLELFNKPASNKSIEQRLISDFNTSPKILDLMNTPLTIRKLSSSKFKSSKSKSKTKSKSSKSKSKTKSKKMLFGNYSYPLLNKIKIPKIDIDMDNLIPYGLMNTKLKSKSIRKSMPKSIPRYTYKSKSKSKSKSRTKTKTKTKIMSKSKSKSKYNPKSVKFMKNNTNSLRDLLSPVRSPSRASRQIIRRATPYVRNTASRLSSFIPNSTIKSQSQSQSPYQSFSRPVQTFPQTQSIISQSNPEELYQYQYPQRENNQIKY